IPLMSGIERSVTIRSGIQSIDRFNAASPSAAVLTSYPCACSVVFKTRVICGSSSTTRILLRSAISARLLGDNVDVDRRRFRQKAVHGSEIQILLPAIDCGASKDHLRDFLFADKIRHCSCNDVSFELNELG